MINLQGESILENWSKKSESSENSQVLESMNPEIGESKVEGFLNTKPIKAFVSEPLLPLFAERKRVSPEDNWPSERLLNREETSQILSQPISAWSNQDEKTNLESDLHTRSIREDHFLSQCTIPDSISPTISDSCLLDGNLNALNGLHETRQTDDASALKLEHETRRDASLNEIEFVCVTPKLISSSDEETWNDFKEESIQGEDNRKHYSVYETDTWKKSRQEDINFRNSESNSTEPFLGHSLSVPYQDVPPARYVVGGRINVEKLILSKRPRSPVRKIFPGRYDLRRGRHELVKQMNKYSAQEYLRSSKDWISEEIKSRLSSDCKPESKEWLLDSILLQVVLEEVILATACENLDIDISTFITIATTWAVTELEALNPEDSITRQSSVSSELVLPQIRSVKRFYSRRSSKKRKLLHFGYQPRSNRDEISHRILSWNLILLAHEQGVTKNYRNIKELIYEESANKGNKFRWPTFDPDVTCHHTGELSRISQKHKNMLSKSEKFYEKWIETCALRVMNFK